MMDYRLVEFWMRLPSIYNLYSEYTKFIARLSMKDKLLVEIVWRKDKKGWQIPQKEWINEGLGTLIRNVVSNSFFIQEIGVNFNFDNLDISVKNHRYCKLSIKLLNLAMWYDTFLNDFSR